MKFGDANDPADEELLDNQVMAELLSQIKPEPPPASLKARLMGQLAAVQPVAGAVTLREADGWRAIAPGIRYKLLYVDRVADSKSFLLQADAGISMPGHQHSAAEECLVLAGSFSMGDLTLHAGDFHCVGPGQAHDVAHTQDGVLVYIRAALQDYPMIRV